MQVGEDVDMPRAVRTGDVAEVERFGVGQADDRGGMESHADREAARASHARAGGQHAPAPLTVAVLTRGKTAAIVKLGPFRAIQPNAKTRFTNP